MRRSRFRRKPSMHLGSGAWQIDIQYDPNILTAVIVHRPVGQRLQSRFRAEHRARHRRVGDGSDG